MLLFRQPPRSIIKGRPSKIELIVDRLAPKMSDAFREASLRAQERVDLDVLAANVEAGRVGRVITQLNMQTFVAEDLTPAMDYLVVAFAEGLRLGGSAVRKANLPVSRFFSAPVSKWPSHKPEDVKTTVTAQLIEVNSLVPTQDVVDSRGPGVSSLDDPIEVYVRDGQMFIGDGHHRAVNAIRRGQKVISANVTYLNDTTPPSVPPAPPLAPKAQIGLDFKTTNPKALLAAERQAADLLTSVNVETKQTIRNLVARAYKEQVSPRDTAKLIRSVIGLNDRQSTALFNYRAGLVEDGRAADQVERMTERYGNKLLRQRADMIAQNEIHRASVRGQKDLWKEGIQEGRINAGTARRIWIANSGACDWCEAVESLNADGVPVDGQYVTPDGDMIDGPEDSHVGCRCSEGLDMQ